MKLMEIYVNNEMPAGTYVGIRFDDETKNKILNMMQELGLKSPISADKLHSTLVYSDKKNLDGFKSTAGVKASAKPKKFSMFDNSQNPNTKCLVVELDSDYLHSRHSDIVSKYGVEEKFTEYKPHITLSYDYDGDLPDDNLLNSLGMLNISDEYDQPIDNNFAKSL